MRQPLDGLASRGWDIQRAIDVFPERTQDSVLFAYAADANRVFVTNDNRVPSIGEKWLANGRRFAGLVVGSWRITGV